MKPVLSVATNGAAEVCGRQCNARERVPADTQQTSNCRTLGPVSASSGRMLSLCVRVLLREEFVCIINLCNRLRSQKKRTVLAAGMGTTPHKLQLPTYWSRYARGQTVGTRKVTRLSIFNNLRESCVNASFAVSFSAELHDAKEPAERE